MRDNPDPVERDVFIDALRVLSVLVVVVGHWLTTTVIWDQGRIEAENALSVVRGSHLSTWLIQVMPLMFFVGGFSNSRSLDRHQGNSLAYLRTRYERLLRPTLVFIGVWIMAGFVAEVLPLPQPNVVDRAADQAALPFWFLGLYVVVVGLAPPLHRLHRRLSWRVPAAMAIGTLIGDIAHYGFDIPHAGVVNFALVWLLAHQLGFFYADGRLAGLPRWIHAAAACGGLAGMIVLTTAADYPVSMVGVPGDERWNTNPPSLALVMLTLWLVALVMLLRPAVAMALTAARRQRGVARLNSVALTIFLWHVSAVSLTTAIIYPLGFPRPDTGTAMWWAIRPLWIAALVPGMLLLVAVFRRWEVHPLPQSFLLHDARCTRHVGAALAVTSSGLGMLGFGVTGFNRIAAALGESVLGFETNPLHNALLLGAGLLLMAAVVGTARQVLLTTTTTAMLYVSIGLIGRSTGIEILGTNPATAVLHLAVGTLALALLGWSQWSDGRAGRI